ncbi:hypothetical protein CYLTODRAFT_359807 [Cylindrobasidium torrendii FP15055 ss-10]|uniref:Uncharacterized protein n=1 Tax=Cylindrobasidium torrendii FP15055 ss-10 TaxID=1314674 RepID=A0A0D7AYU3_9AGAR|nr:hypothetical protein CYLTODRAFT_359807 [Cylindrobasidium torrendii FP15055 ss-10]
MADSLSEACTPLKQAYDTCFNAWFEGYLEPAVAVRNQQNSREVYAKQKAEEFEAKCGKLWVSYKSCIQGALKEKGIDDMLKQAREEHPLKEAVPVPSSPSK